MIWLATLPAWAKAALGGAVVVAIMFGGGWAYVERERRHAAVGAVQALQDETRRQRLENITRERGRADEINTLGDDDLRDRLGRWIVHQN